LQELSESRHERIAAQARRALVNLGKGNRKWGFRVYEGFPGIQVGR
jgi:hypothetical protein